MNKMQKAIKRTPVHKQVFSHYEEKEMYVTNDGREYETEVEAIKHENAVIYHKIEQRDLEYEFDPLFMHRAMRPANEEELKALKVQFDVGHKYDSPVINNHYDMVGDVLKVGEWIFYRYNPHGDHDSENYLYTYSYLKQQMESFIEEFKG
jgi:hypothetical protein